MRPNGMNWRRGRVWCNWWQRLMLLQLWLLTIGHIFAQGQHGTTSSQLTIVKTPRFAMRLAQVQAHLIILLLLLLLLMMLIPRSLLRRPTHLQLDLDFGECHWVVVLVLLETVIVKIVERLVTLTTVELSGRVNIKI